MCWLARAVVWLQMGPEPNWCPFNLRKPHPHNTRSLSHNAEWLWPLWLHSICRHSSSTLSLFLISLPPLHFSKLRCSFVSLQWFRPSTLPVAFPPVSCSCRDSWVVVLHWMTNQGHACNTFTYLYLYSFLATYGTCHILFYCSQLNFISYILWRVEISVVAFLPSPTAPTFHVTTYCTSVFD